MALPALLTIKEVSCHQQLQGNLWRNWKFWYFSGTVSVSDLKKKKLVIFIIHVMGLKLINLPCK